MKPTILMIVITLIIVITSGMITYFDYQYNKRLNYYKKEPLAFIALIISSLILFSQIFVYISTN